MWMIPPYHQWLLRLSAIPIVHLAVIPTSSKMVYLVWIEIYIPHLLLVSLLNWEARPKSEEIGTHRQLYTRTASWLPRLHYSKECVSDETYTVSTSGDISKCKAKPTLQTTLVQFQNIWQNGGIMVQLYWLHVSGNHWYYYQTKLL